VELHHAGTKVGLDAARFLERERIDHGNIVFAAHHYPDFLAVGGEEAFMRRAADVGLAFDLVGGGVDEGHRVGAVGDDQQRLVIGREAQSVDVGLAAYSGDSTSGRELPSLIWPSRVLVAGLKTDTVLVFWSAV
jgi:hypothetical protein